MDPQFSEADVQECLKSVKGSQAKGRDGISQVMLKHAKTKGNACLADLINNSIRELQLPARGNEPL